MLQLIVFMKTQLTEFQVSIVIVFLRAGFTFKFNVVFFCFVTYYLASYDLY